MMEQRERKIRICVVLIGLNLAFIWGNSLLPGEISGALSDGVKQILARLFSADASDPSGGGLLRKMAHFTEFAVLGLLLTRLLTLLGKRGWYALPWGILAAAVDETIQIFVPDRGPALTDVGIDACGVLTGMILLITGHRILRGKQPIQHGGK